MNLLLKIFVIFLSLGSIYGKPQQIHLSLGANPSEMTVSFTVLEKTDTSMVRYNKMNGPVKTVSTHQNKFEDKDYKVHIHRATLTGLEAGQVYEYQCGTDGTWSDIFRFKAVPNQADTSLKLAIYGDLGLENGVSLPQIKKDVEMGMYDTILHIGDIAYDLNEVGDKFMEELQPIAAKVPYQTCPGNHEHKRNFTHYLNRFSMIDSKSGQMNNHYYSFDLGPAHFIFWSSEIYFYPQFFTESNIEWQFKWIENDLKEASKPQNRQKRPWIITLAHRPMYCLDKDNGEDCFHHESVIRSGLSSITLKKTTSYGLEDLFHKYGVDIQFYGHKHTYARSYPIYNFNTTKTGRYYENPKSSVHIISGSAGTTDRPTIDQIRLPDYMAFQVNDWGFTRMNIQNKTHIFFDQYSTEHNKIVDSFVIKKDRHQI